MKYLMILASLLFVSACHMDHDAAGGEVLKSHSNSNGACGLRKMGKSHKSHGHGARACADHTHDGDDHGHSH